MGNHLPLETFSFGFRRILDGLLFLSFAGLLCCGCSRHKTNLSTEEAQKALETVLTAWQNGQAAGKIEDSSPPIEVVDADWMNGKKLESFEILGEQSKVEDRLVFSARLHFHSPKESKEVNYVIVGGVPIRISQQQDYDRGRRWQGFKQGKKGNQK